MSSPSPKVSLSSSPHENNDDLKVSATTPSDVAKTTDTAPVALTTQELGIALHGGEQTPVEEVNTNDADKDHSTPVENQRNNAKAQSSLTSPDAPAKAVENTEAGGEVQTTLSAVQPSNQREGTASGVPDDENPIIEVHGYLEVLAIHGETQQWLQKTGMTKPERREAAKSQLSGPNRSRKWAGAGPTRRIIPATGAHRNEVATRGPSAGLPSKLGGPTKVHTSASNVPKHDAARPKTTAVETGSQRVGTASRVPPKTPEQAKITEPSPKQNKLSSPTDQTRQMEPRQDNIPSQASPTPPNMVGGEGHPQREAKLPETDLGKHDGPTYEQMTVVRRLPTSDSAVTSPRVHIPKTTVVRKLQSTDLLQTSPNKLEEGGRPIPRSPLQTVTRNQEASNSPILKASVEKAAASSAGTPQAKLPVSKTFLDTAKKSVLASENRKKPSETVMEKQIKVKPALKKTAGRGPSSEKLDGTSLTPSDEPARHESVKELAVAERMLSNDTNVKKLGVAKPYSPTKAGAADNKKQGKMPQYAKDTATKELQLSSSHADVGDAHESASESRPTDEALRSDTTDTLDNKIPSDFNVKAGDGSEADGKLPERVTATNVEKEDGGSASLPSVVEVEPPSTVSLITPLAKAKLPPLKKQQMPKSTTKYAANDKNQKSETKHGLPSQASQVTVRAKPESAESHPVVSMEPKQLNKKPNGDQPALPKPVETETDVGDVRKEISSFSLSRMIKSGPLGSMLGWKTASKKGDGRRNKADASVVLSQTSLSEEKKSPSSSIRAKPNNVDLGDTTPLLQPTLSEKELPLSSLDHSAPETLESVTITSSVQPSVTEEGRMSTRPIRADSKELITTTPPSQSTPSEMEGALGISNPESREAVEQVKSANSPQRVLAEKEKSVSTQFDQTSKEGEAVASMSPPQSSTTEEDLPSNVLDHGVPETTERATIVPVLPSSETKQKVGDSAIQPKPKKIQLVRTASPPQLIPASPEDTPQVVDSTTTPEKVKPDTASSQPTPENQEKILSNPLPEKLNDTEALTTTSPPQIVPKDINVSPGITDNAAPEKVESDTTVPSLKRVGVGERKTQSGSVRPGEKQIQPVTATSASLPSSGVKKAPLRRLDDATLGKAKAVKLAAARQPASILNKPAPSGPRGDGQRNVDATEAFTLQAHGTIVVDDISNKKDLIDRGKKRNVEAREDAPGIELDGNAGAAPKNLTVGATERTKIGKTIPEKKTRQDTMIPAPEERKGKSYLTDDAASKDVKPEAKESHQGPATLPNESSSKSLEKKIVHKMQPVSSGAKISTSKTKVSPNLLGKKLSLKATSPTSTPKSSPKFPPKKAAILMTAKTEMKAPLKQKTKETTTSRDFKDGNQGTDVKSQVKDTTKTADAVQQHESAVAENALPVVTNGRLSKDQSVKEKTVKKTSNKKGKSDKSLTSKEIDVRPKTKSSSSVVESPLHGVSKKAPSEALERYQRDRSVSGRDTGGFNSPQSFKTKKEGRASEVATNRIPSGPFKKGDPKFEGSSEQAEKKKVRSAVNMNGLQGALGAKSIENTVFSRVDAKHALTADEEAFGESLLDALESAAKSGSQEQRNWEKRMQSSSGEKTEMLKDAAATSVSGDDFEEKKHVTKKKRKKSDPKTKETGIAEPPKEVVAVKKVAARAPRKMSEPVQPATTQAKTSGKRIQGSVTVLEQQREKAGLKAKMAVPKDRMGKHGVEMPPKKGSTINTTTLPSSRLVKNAKSQKKMEGGSLLAPPNDGLPNLTTAKPVLTKIKSDVVNNRERSSLETVTGSVGSNSGLRSQESTESAFRLKVTQSLRDGVESYGARRRTDSELLSSQGVPLNKRTERRHMSLTLGTKGVSARFWKDKRLDPKKKWTRAGKPSLLLGHQSQTSSSVSEGQKGITEALSPMSTGVLEEGNVPQTLMGARASGKGRDPHYGTVPKVSRRRSVSAGGSIKKASSGSVGVAGLPVAKVPSGVGGNKGKEPMSIGSTAQTGWPRRSKAGSVTTGRDGGEIVKSVSRETPELSRAKGRQSVGKLKRAQSPTGSAEVPSYMSINSEERPEETRDTAENVKEYFPQQEVLINGRAYNLRFGEQRAQPSTEGALEGTVFLYTPYVEMYQYPAAFRNSFFEMVSPLAMTHGIAAQNDERLFESTTSPNIRGLDGQIPGVSTGPQALQYSPASRAPDVPVMNAGGTRRNRVANDYLGDLSQPVTSTQNRRPPLHSTGASRVQSGRTFLETCFSCSLCNLCNEQRREEKSGGGGVRQDGARNNVNAQGKEQLIKDRPEPAAAGYRGSGSGVYITYTAQQPLRVNAHYPLEPPMPTEEEKLWLKLHPPSEVEDNPKYQQNRWYYEQQRKKMEDMEQLEAVRRQARWKTAPSPFV